MNGAPNPTPDDDVDRTEDLAPLKAEAKRRRLALRAVEAERDDRAARLDAAHQAEVERLAADRFTDPRDVSAVTSIDAMRGSDGRVDPEKVEAELNRIEADRPHWRKQAEPEPEPEHGLPHVHQRPRSSPEPSAPNFGDVVKDAIRR